jgi:hypothetical protein
VPDDAGIVFGLLQMGDGDFERLDRWEGGYERVTLRVEDDAGRQHDVTSYAVREKGSFRPHELYLSKILSAAERLGFPSEYVAELRARYGP